MARNRLTLLDTVQRVLDSLGSDQVNSISDTIEATQIANEARTVYYDMMDMDEWPHLISNRKLEAVADTDHPNYLKIPQDVSQIIDVRYVTTEAGDTDKTVKQIVYMEPEHFLDYIYKRSTSDTNVIEITEIATGIPLWIINDEPPMYWTSFDDEYLVFDAYDTGVDSTLQESKSLIRAKTIPTWTASDTFVPDMPDQMFSTFLAELTSACFLYLKQTNSPKDDQRARRGVSRLRRKASKVNERDRYVRYGRKRPRIYGSKDDRTGSIEASLHP